MILQQHRQYIWSNIPYLLVLNLYIVIYRIFRMNEWHIAEYWIAQSGTSRVPHFAPGLLKKRLDQRNRQELHAAISCHAFCSTAWLSPLFCTYSCQQYQLNTTQCSTSCGKCAQLNCPHTQRHSHIRTCIQIAFTHTQLLWSFPGSMTWLPMFHKKKKTLFWIQQQKATATSWPFLPPS